MSTENLTNKQNDNSGEEVLDFGKGYQQLMLLYESAMKQMITRLEILNSEYKMLGDRNPIETIKHRLKTPQSIGRKMKRYGFELSIPSIEKNLNDVAGVRVVCSYISDIYLIRDMLASQSDVTLIAEKDYIKNPKSNGYRSLHLIVEIPVYLTKEVHKVRVEVQIRTIAMNFWSSLEHDIRYKVRYKGCEDIPIGVVKELYECAEVIAQTDKRMEEIASKLHQL